ncbi:Peroxidase 2 [Rhizoctonia solani]|uniref:Peroxidase 2 n=1 Tax=Rhizoctonia solani TaxID=456999 RepID=A0A0K6G2Q0_9AGAM|nr:Peroxidase 2 [Rhizoctonia solani]
MSKSSLAASNPDTVDLRNVQGDIILGFPKKKEEFIFFVIQDKDKFQKALGDLKVTDTVDVIEARKKIQEKKLEQSGGLLPLSFLNVAFSKKGFKALGIQGDIGGGEKEPFDKGQYKSAEKLGDVGTGSGDDFVPDWENPFLHEVHGVFLVAGESWTSVNTKVQEVEAAFTDSFRVVYRLKGSVRPGDQKGHEHFGWLDGVSDPAVKGIVEPLPGQRVIPPGVILCGKTRDPFLKDRPTWALEGSFLAFRQLEQLVPEFDKFLEDNPIIFPGTSRKYGSELLGARLVGRWKSGAPVQLRPLYDDPALGKDEKRNNDFVYPQDKGDAGQFECPYAAHIRKTNPRNDLDFLDPNDPGRAVEESSIIRTGIPYGPEMTLDEKQENETEFERGLAFVCYQSSLEKGFEFIQKSWANNPDFPIGKDVQPGFDPIIGENHGLPRPTMGASDGSHITLMRDFVVSRGGEYFFSPSIRALQTTFAGIKVA